MRLSFLLAGFPLLAQGSADLSSIRKERALGADLAAQTRLDSKLLGIAAVSEFVDWIGDRLAKAVAQPKFDYRFDIIIDAEVEEPFGFPGGFVFVPAKFFLAARDESEFAGMLAHVIVHIEQRHGLMAARVERSRDRRVPMIFMGSRAGSHIGAQRTSAVMPNGQRELHLRNELVSDELAVPLLVKAGFDPAGLRRYIGRVQPEESRQKRLDSLGAALAKVEAASVPSDSTFDRMRDLVRAATSARQAKVPSLRR